MTVLPDSGPIVPGLERHLARHWGARVAAARQHSGRSQQSVARACGVSQQTISKVERGEMLAGDRLKWYLAETLEVAPGQLFAWPRPTAPEEWLAGLDTQARPPDQDPGGGT